MLIDQWRAATQGRISCLVFPSNLIGAMCAALLDLLTFKVEEGRDNEERGVIRSAAFG